MQGNRREDGVCSWVVSANLPTPASGKKARRTVGFGRGDDDADLWILPKTEVVHRCVLCARSPASFGVRAGPGSGDSQKKTKENSRTSSGPGKKSDTMHRQKSNPPKAKDCSPQGVTHATCLPRAPNNKNDRQIKGHLALVKRESYLRLPRNNTVCVCVCLLREIGLVRPIIPRPLRPTLAPTNRFSPARKGRPQRR